MIERAVPTASSICARLSAREPRRPAEVAHGLIADGHTVGPRHDGALAPLRELAPLLVAQRREALGHGGEEAGHRVVERRRVGATALLAEVCDLHGVEQLRDHLGIGVAARVWVPVAGPLMRAAGPLQRVAGTGTQTVQRV